MTERQKIIKWLKDFKRLSKSEDNELENIENFIIIESHWEDNRNNDQKINKLKNFLEKYYLENDYKDKINLENHDEILLESLSEEKKVFNLINKNKKYSITFIEDLWNKDIISFVTINMLLNNNNSLINFGYFKNENNIFRHSILNKSFFKQNETISFEELYKKYNIKSSKINDFNNFILSSLEEKKFRKNFKSEELHKKYLKFHFQKIKNNEKFKNFMFRNIVLNNIERIDSKKLKLIKQIISLYNINIENSNILLSNINNLMFFNSYELERFIRFKVFFPINDSKILNRFFSQSLYSINFAYIHFQYFKNSNELSDKDFIRKKLINEDKNNSNIKQIIENNLSRKHIKFINRLSNRQKNLDYIHREVINKKIFNGKKIEKEKLFFIALLNFITNMKNESLNVNNINNYQYYKLVKMFELSFHLQIINPKSIDIKDSSFISKYSKNKDEYNNLKISCFDFKEFIYEIYLYMKEKTYLENNENDNEKEIQFNIENFHKYNLKEFYKNVEFFHNSINDIQDTIRIYKTNNEISNKIIKQNKFIIEEKKVININNKDYIVVPLISTQDLINESILLNHCVESYNKKVLTGDSLIFSIINKEEFNKKEILLKKEKSEENLELIKKSFSTLEIKFDNNLFYINQHRGFENKAQFDIEHNEVANKILDELNKKVKNGFNWIEYREKNYIKHNLYEKLNERKISPECCHHLFNNNKTLKKLTIIRKMVNNIYKENNLLE